MYVKEQKKQLRLQMETKRSALSVSERKVKSTAICRSAIESILEPLFTADEPFSDTKPVLFTYIPAKAEVDVTPILEWCWLNQVATAVPRVIKEGRGLTLHLIKDFEELQEGAYGIYEPKRSVPEMTSPDRIRAMIVPGLAFDPQMGRLGYGGGYYDRFVRRCLEQTGKQPFKLGLAYEVQIVPHVPMASHDLTVDAIVTEASVYQLNSPS